MSETFYLWSGRMQGWLSPGGTYVSQLSAARSFTESEAFDYCRMHYNNGFSEYGLFPIRVSDLERCKP